MKTTADSINKFLGKNSAKIIIIIVVVLLALILLMYWGYKHAPTDQGESYSPGTSQSSQQANNPKPSSSTPVATNISYSEAVHVYENKRMQFDENCVASPGYLTLNHGVSFMLDNRGSKARSIYLDGREYAIAAYGFKIVTLSYPQLPHTIMVDCGSGKNNGRILIQ